eukprot:416633-Amphidinium_carterae.1
MAPHVDGNNMHHSDAIATGDYEGGRLWMVCDDGDEHAPLRLHCDDRHLTMEEARKLKGKYVDTFNHWRELDGRRVHGVEPWKGERVSLVLFAPVGAETISGDVLKQLQ